MAQPDPLDLKRIDREIKIAQLKEESAAIGEFYPDEIWELIYRFEHAPMTTEYRLLVEAGVDLPEPDELDDDALTAKLWEVIERLASWRVYLSCTDHLSDRELYTALVTDVLHKGRPDVDPSPGETFEIDMLGGCSEEDIELYFRYYVEEGDRAVWGPDYANMPAHEQPPYDRDRWLPRGECELSE